MLEQDVLVSQNQRKKERSVEVHQADIQAAVRDTLLACHMASGQCIAHNRELQTMTTTISTLALKRFSREDLCIVI